jgi:hypothetical protein
MSGALVPGTPLTGTDSTTSTPRPSIGMPADPGFDRRSLPDPSARKFSLWAREVLIALSDLVDPLPANAQHPGNLDGPDQVVCHCLIISIDTPQDYPLYSCVVTRDGPGGAATPRGPAGTYEGGTDMAIVRQRASGEPSRPAELLPGELVWASVINGLESSRATGKLRPVILIQAQGSQWKTMGLTTKPFYRDGSPRVLVPNPGAVGLTGQGWLWSGRPCWVSGIDVFDHIGWVDVPLAFEVIKLAGFEGAVLKSLLVAAREHHGHARPDGLHALRQEP